MKRASTWIAGRTAGMIGVVGLAAGVASAGVAPVVSAELVVKEGDAMSDSTVASLNAPFTNGNGQVGFVVALDDGERAIWFDTGPIFLSDSALPDVLTGGEGTMGIGDNGEFIYSPSFNGGDAVYGEGGVIAEDNAPAFDFASGFNMTFHSRPRMIDDGSSYWISGTNDGAGGTSTQNRIIYMRDGTTGTITGILRAGDVVDGVTVAGAGGIDFDNAMSDDGTQRLFIFNDASGSSANDGRLAVNGSIVASEASPASDGLDNWDNFDATSINTSGNYMFSGDTDGASTTDEFIAYNGAIQLRQGDTLTSGPTLDGSVDGLSLNNNGEAVFIWDIDDAGGDIETLFYASDASDLAGTAEAVLSVGENIDTSGDGVADWELTDFNASAAIGPGLDFAENGVLYIEVDLIPVAGGDEIEAILCIPVVIVLPCNAADLAPEFGVLDLADVGAFIGGFGNDPISDLNNDGVWDLTDVGLFVSAFLAGCP